MLLDPMTTDVVLVDRDPRRRPKDTWRYAWTGADHLGGTISTLRHARRAIERGGWRAVALPMLACLIVGATFLGVAFGAAVLAGQADSSTTRGGVLILASVALSQALTLVQGQKPVKRLFVAAEARVEWFPFRWGGIDVQVPMALASRAKKCLESAFPYVEVRYYRHGAEATLTAWFGPVAMGTDRPDLRELAEAALGAFPHTLANTISWNGVE